AGQPNLPIEQLFKRVRLNVAGSTAGKQIPWESSSLTSDFYFFGDTAVAATRAPNRGPVVAAASNLPSRSVQQAYDYVLSEGQPQYYQQFIEMYPHDPLCDRIRWLLRNLIVAQAWHKTVLANSPFAYKTFADNFGDSPLAKVAANLQNKPKEVPLMQATKLIVSPQLAPNLKQPVNFGLPKDGIKIGENNGQVKINGGLGINLPGKDNTAGNGNTGINGGKIVTLPVNNGGKTDGASDKKIVTLPAPNSNGTPANGNTGINGGKIGTLPINNGGKTAGQDSKVDVKTSMPVNRVTTLPVTPRQQQLNNAPVMKLNNNPSMGNKLNPGNPQPAKMSFNNGGNNGGARMAMGGGMGRGF
ncbi:MAG TPA: caspase family protein, partial [Bradyrhizobium sp.]|nr:caspase family protein [Bradyrhizobium sp.]